MTDENKENKEVKEIVTATSSNTADLTAFYGKKIGMTQMFDERTGEHLPVTVVELIPNFVSQVKTDAKDGYSAYQIGYYSKRDKLVNKPTKVRLSKANINENLCRFFEIRLKEVSEDNLGAKISYANFSIDTMVDVVGTSKGKGFQGVMKKYNFQGGPASHGSHFHRAPGSIGNRATPSRVFPLKKMPGQMGNKRVTVQKPSRCRSRS